MQIRRGGDAEIAAVEPEADAGPSQAAINRCVPAIPPQKPRPRTIASAAPSSAASATSGVCDEKGIAVDARSSASSTNEPTGSSTFAMSNGSRSASARLAVSNRQPMFASRRSARSGPIAARTSRTRRKSSSTGWTATLPSKTGRIVLLDHPRAVARRPRPETPRPGPVREVLAELDLRCGPSPPGDRAAARPARAPRCPRARSRLPRADCG